jgi:type IV pilus assembly protein PilA
MKFSIIIKMNINFFRKKSFSLIELMVVIAIIGILSAIAVPSYKNYIIKTKVASAIQILSKGIDDIIQISENSSTGFPANPLQIFNATLNWNAGTAGFAAINTPPVNYISFYSPGGTGSGGGLFCVYLYDIGIPGYTAPTGNPWNNDGTYNQLCMLAVLQDNIYKKYCGTMFAQSGNGSYIAKQYLPSGCNCVNINSLTYYYNPSTNSSCITN